MPILTEENQRPVMIFAVRKVHRLTHCKFFCAFRNSNLYLHFQKGCTFLMYQARTIDPYKAELTGIYKTDKIEF